MMKKHNVLSLVLAFCLCFMVAMPAFAADSTTVTDSVGEVAPRAHDVEYKKVEINRVIKEDVPIGFAGGQPQNGTTFSSPGGFYWTDGGYNVNVSISVAWKLLSASIACGKVGGTTGNYIEAPVNTPCKLFIRKDLLCIRAEEYERLIGTTEWKFTGYYDTVTPVGTHLEVRYGNGFNQVWRG